jgi:hypothetical protein
MVYIPGTYLQICDRCGFRYRNTQTRKEWTGLIVCKGCFETKHPQLTVKPKKDMQAVRHARPEAEDVYLSTAYADRVKAEDL